jgi:hypothetical protein
MESPSVRGKVGSHVADWCNNPEKELYHAIPKSLDTGLLRLETTFYRYNTGKRLDLGFVEEQMDFLESLIPKHLLFHNPIAKQYELLLEHVNSNTYIIDTDKKIALFSLYLNHETGKTNGFYVKDTDSNKLSNILKYYSFDVPISVILLKRTEQSLLFQHDTYTRRLEVGKKRDAVELVTYVAAGSEYFKHRPFHVGEKQPFDRGLLDHPKAKLRLQNKRMDLAKTQTSNVNISLVRTDNLPLQFIGISIRSTNREIRESSNMESFKLASEKQLAEIKEKKMFRNKRFEKIHLFFDKPLVESFSRIVPINSNL